MEPKKTLVGSYCRRPHDSPVGSEMQRLLHSAKHFVLDLPQEEAKAFHDLGFESFAAGKLPYPAFTVSTYTTIAASQHPVGVITLVTLAGAHSFVDKGDHTCEISFVFEVHGLGWVYSPFVFLFDANGRYSPRATSQKSADWIEETEDETLEGIRKVCAHAASKAIAVVGALSCTNIRAAVSDKAPPESVNSKRVAKGKSRIYDTHTLVVHVHDQGKGKGRCLGGSHASPRQHLRRGHIRQLDKGNIWVQPHLVGDASRGFINRTVRITA